MKKLWLPIPAAPSRELSMRPTQKEFHRRQGGYKRHPSLTDEALMPQIKNPSPFRLKGRQVVR